MAEEYTESPSDFAPAFSRSEIGRSGAGVIIDDSSISDSYAWSSQKISDQDALKANKNNAEFTGAISLGRKANTFVGVGSIAVGSDVTASGR